MSSSGVRVQKSFPHGLYELVSTRKKRRAVGKRNGFYENSNGIPCGSSSGSLQSEGTMFASLFFSQHICPNKNETEQNKVIASVAFEKMQPVLPTRRSFENSDDMHPRHFRTIGTVFLSAFVTFRQLGSRSP
jgi:hypothetical protein